MKKILGLVAIATLALVSCNKEEGVQVDQTPKSVAINIANAVANTRTMSAGITDGADVKLNNLYVFFVDASGNIYKGETETGAVKSHYFKASDFKGYTEAYVEKDEQEVFHFVDPKATRVIVYGNPTESKETLDALKTITSLKGAVYTIDTQQNTEALTLWGEGAITTTSDFNEKESDHPLYQANVNLIPLVSRVEIESFEYEGTGDDKDQRKYASIAISQVMFNSYYNKATFPEAKVVVTSDEKVDQVLYYVNKTNVWDILKTATDVTPEPWYNNDLTVELATEAYKEDYKDKVRPAYNFFPKVADISDVYTSVEVAETPGTYTNTQGGHPQLVISLVGTDANGVKTPHYLATSKFVADGTPGVTKVTQDLAQVYRLSFKFNDTNLTAPEKCVEVNVTVANWEVIPVVPEF